MRELLEFFKEIFMFNSEDKMRVGLSQFKQSKQKILQPKKSQLKKSEVKLSDLMRRSV